MHLMHKNICCVKDELIIMWMTYLNTTMEDVAFNLNHGHMDNSLKFVDL
jgi:hypothetical protein